MKNTTRYSRQIALADIGDSGQQKLQDARVLVIGAGGLGCPVLQNLAAAGVGSIGIVDGDVVEESNLHRQLLYGLKDCGKGKASTAAEAVLELNPDVNVTVFAEFFNKQNAAKIVSGYQIIVDCTDTISVRYLINDVAVTKNIPVVYASIYKFEGQVSVFNYKNGPSYRCLFPETESFKTVPNCVVSGVLGVLPNTLGAFQATEVLKIILEIGTVLSGTLLIYDGLHFQTQSISFSKNQKEIEKGMKNGLVLLEQTGSTENLNSDLFLEKCNLDNWLIIDIREVYEEPKINASNVVNVPLSDLEDYFSTFDRNRSIILFCQSGQRSQAALNYLRKKGFTQLLHLTNGIQSLMKDNNNVNIDLSIIATNNRV